MSKFALVLPGVKVVAFKANGDRIGEVVLTREFIARKVRDYSLVGMPERSVVALWDEHGRMILVAGGDVSIGEYKVEVRPLQKTD